MDYAEYLPHIEVESAKARVMNNFALYLRLVEKFGTIKMVDNVRSAMESGDVERIWREAHAFRGTVANLGFVEVQKVAYEIEKSAREGKDCAHLREPFEEAVTALEGAIKRLLSSCNRL
jgi:HPt (histidine-containing phosphotransfer) domain-containing protein